MGYEEAGPHEHEDTDEQCGCIDKHEGRDVYLGGSFADIIICRVERDKTGSALKQDDGSGEKVADNHTLADDEYGKPQEGVAHGCSLHAKGFENANHLGALENDDEQTRNHRESSHTYHEGKDNPYINVEKRQP